jgi:hypothetical protein
MPMRFSLSYLVIFAGTGMVKGTYGPSTRACRSADAVMAAAKRMLRLAAHFAGPWFQPEEFAEGPLALQSSAVDWNCAFE